MGKPVATTGWTAASGKKTEPPAGKKLVGFTGGEQPPEAWLNFLFSKIEEWLAQYKAEGVDTVDDYSLSGAITLEQKLVLSTADEFFRAGTSGRSLRFWSKDSAAQQEWRIGINCDPAEFATSPGDQITNADDTEFNVNAVVQIWRIVSSTLGTTIQVFTLDDAEALPWAGGTTLDLRQLFKFQMLHADAAGTYEVDGPITGVPLVPVAADEVTAKSYVDSEVAATNNRLSDVNWADVAKTSGTIAAGGTVKVIFARGTNIPNNTFIVSCVAPNDDEILCSFTQSSGNAGALPGNGIQDVEVVVFNNSGVPKTAVIRVTWLTFTAADGGTVTQT